MDNMSDAIADWIANICRMKKITQIGEEYHISHAGEHAAIKMVVTGGTLALSAYDNSMKTFDLQDPEFHGKVESSVREMLRRWNLVQQRLYSVTNPGE